MIKVASSKNMVWRKKWNISTLYFTNRSNHTFPHYLYIKKRKDPPYILPLYHLLFDFCITPFVLRALSYRLIDVIPLCSPLRNIHLAALQFVGMIWTIFHITAFVIKYASGRDDNLLPPNTLPLRLSGRWIMPFKVPSHTAKANNCCQW